LEALEEARLDPRGLSGVNDIPLGRFVCGLHQLRHQLLSPRLVSCGNGLLELLDHAMKNLFAP
jgi:hypothetical protein